MLDDQPPPSAELHTKVGEQGGHSVGGERDAAKASPFENPRTTSRAAAEMTPGSMLHGTTATAGRSRLENGNGFSHSDGFTDGYPLQEIHVQRTTISRTFGHFKACNAFM